MNLRTRINRSIKSLANQGKQLTNRMKSSYTKADIVVVAKKPKSFIKIAANLLHRIVVLCVRFILQKIHGERGDTVKPIRDLILLESAVSLAYKIRTGKLSSVSVLKSFIKRIEEINPQLNCVVDERFQEALLDAESADNLIASGKYTEAELIKEKPFLGVPISTKDCLAVKGMIHTAGICKRRHIRATNDSGAMKLMRSAGAIPFALTNVSEACMWWESSNPVHGRSRNPYDSNRIVGGSSGGEGCLLASAGSPFGIGSDIGGSIRMPAFFNGIFGHKPSKFIVSNEGQWPIPTHDEQKSFLGIGPMCRFATDLKPTLKIMAGYNATKLRLDEPVNVANIRYFYQENDGGGQLISPVDHDQRNALDKVVKHLQTTLKVKTKRCCLEKLQKSTAIWMANMKNDGKIGFDSQLLNLEGRINPYLELFKWVFGYSRHTFIAIMTALTENTGIKYGSAKYHYLVEQRNELQQEFDKMLGEDGVFLYPTHPTVAPYHNEPIIRALNFSYTGIINVLGLPATAVPLGIGQQGLPIGIQVVANMNQDRLCLAVACELERAFGGWVPPTVDA